MRVATMKPFYKQQPHISTNTTITRYNGLLTHLEVLLLNHIGVVHLAHVIDHGVGAVVDGFDKLRGDGG